MDRVRTKAMMRRKLAALLGTVTVLGWLCFTGYAQPTVEVKEAVISGRLIAKIGDGDFACPTFSPDGTMLAYSRALVRKGSDVLLYNLRTHQTRTLLNSAKADGYQGWIKGIHWPSRKRLDVEITDGDGVYRMIYNPLTRKLVRGEYIEPGDDERLLPTAWQKTRKQALSLFPEWATELSDILNDRSPAVMPGRGIILQKKYGGPDQHVWFLDFQTGLAKQLVSSSENDYGVLAGGLSFGDSLLVLLAHGSSTYPFTEKLHLLLCQKEQCRKLIEMDAPLEHGGIEVRHQSAARVMFLIRAYTHNEEGNIPFFVFDGKQLTWSKFPGLYDADVSPQGNRVAYCYRENGNRHIVVKELNLRSTAGTATVKATRTGHERIKPSPFQGHWSWSYYLKDKDLRDPDTVEIYNHLASGQDIREVPLMTLDLDLTQKGNVLSGECFSAMRFASKLDGADFTAVIKGNVAYFELESSHGGKAIVRLTSRRNRLYWRIVRWDNSEGNAWYPPRAVLHRTRRKDSVTI